jgi:DNA-binding NarL/FixJ family response regulator
MKILIADDHPIFRNGLKSILVENFKEAIIVECVNGAEALENIRKEKPDVSILDINMPEMDGLELCNNIMKEGLSTKVVMLTMYRDSEMLKKAFHLGAFGYLLKDFATKEIIECIDNVLKDIKYIGPGLDKHYSSYLQEDKIKKDIVGLLKNLSQAELKTLKLVSQNKTSKEISELLFLSEKTVENYRSRICQKLQLPPRNNSLLLWIAENKELLRVTSEF